MRKIKVFNRLTVDGYFAGPHGEIDWFVQDPNVDASIHQSMNPDTLLMGGITYQLFASFWPPLADDPHAPEGARTTARELNQMTKIVFSKTLKKAEWQNSQLFHDNLISEVKKLKQGDGSDIAIFGSGTIVQQLANEDLIDEYLLVITPVVLGKGKLLFDTVRHQNLELVATKQFDSGNVLLHYKPRTS